MMPSASVTVAYAPLVIHSMVVFNLLRGNQLPLLLYLHIASGRDLWFFLLANSKSSYVAYNLLLSSKDQDRVNCGQ